MKANALRIAKPVAQAVPERRQFMRLTRVYTGAEVEEVDLHVKKTLQDALQDDKRLHMIGLHDRDMIMLLAKRNRWNLENT